MKKNLLFFTLLGIFSLTNAQIFYTNTFDNPAEWNMNTNPASISPVQGANDASYNPWVINSSNYFTPTGPISGNSLKITIQSGTDFDGFGLSSGLTGYDPFNVNEPNLTDAITLLNSDISTVGRTGIILEFDYQTGGWQGEDYGTVVYSTDGGTTWTELDNSYTVTYTTVDMNNSTASLPLTAPAAPNLTTDLPAFSNIDGFSSGTLWHRATIQLPASCDNIPNLRIGFRWRNIVHVSNSPDYVGVSFNVDNVALRVAPPVANFTFTPVPACQTEGITFDPSTSSAGGGISITDYIWTFPGGTPSSSTAMSPVVSYASPGTYYASLQVVNNVGDTSTVLTKDVIVTDCKPTANFSAEQAVCQDSILTFTDVSLNMDVAHAPLSWSWTFPGGTPASATGQGPHDVTFATLGKKTVQLIVSNTYGADTIEREINVVDCQCSGLIPGGTATIWTETFDGTGNWNTGALNQTVGVEGCNANPFFISDAEGGVAAGGCGVGGNGNQTLHVGSISFGDIGAAYDAGGGAACGDLFACLFGGGCNTTADRRSTSLDINTVGQSNLTLTFDYIETGSGANDNAYVEYSTDGGATWSFLYETPKTNNAACAPQGTWTNVGIINLPASCENIPNLRIGFRWQNNNDGVGSDPSFAVNDIIIQATTPPTLPKTWLGSTSNDWNIAANWSDGVVPTNTDDILVPDNATLTSLCPTCVMPEIYNADAAANNVCNYGTITIHDTPTKRTLTVNGDLLNEGVITTTTDDASFDVLFVGANSHYSGTGTNDDVDYLISSGLTTLNADLSCRTLQISTDFDFSGQNITVKKNFYRTTGTVSTDVNSTVIFDGPCTTCIDNTDDQELGSNIGITIPNLVMDKSSGVLSLSTGSVHSISNKMTIIQGTVDQGTGQITGVGDLEMQDGLFMISRLSTTLPQISGTYDLTGGKIQLYGAGAQTLRGAKQYYNLEFAGSDIKTLGGDVEVKNNLELNLPTTVGNYVDAAGNTLFVSNTGALAISRTGGHIVGNLQRAILSSSTYRFFVGSDGTDTDGTYYEPIDIQTISLLTTSDITVAFNDNAPNPLTLTPNLFEWGGTFTDMETEGYWEVNPDVQPTGGTYTLTQYPSTAWTYSAADYTQVKQILLAAAWEFGTSSRVTALKRKEYSSFSNFGIASTIIPLAVESMKLEGETHSGISYLTWRTQNEHNSSHFEIEKSKDGTSFSKIGTLESQNNPVGATYNLEDKNILNNQNYYRIKEVSFDGAEFYSNTILLTQEDAVLFSIYPNPVTNGFLHYEYSRKSSLNLILTNVLGQNLMEKTIKNSGSLDISYLPSGSYIIKIVHQNGKEEFKKFVKK